MTGVIQSVGEGVSYVFPENHVEITWWAICRPGDLPAAICFKASNLGESLQSAYKRHPSTESALLKAHNELLKAVDNRQTVVLLLLDLSAAFDTVDHGILIHRLESTV